MKIKILSLILAKVSLLFSFNAIAIAQINVNPILEMENGNCEKTVELFYDSQKLVSPDGNTSVYFEGILRRIGKKSDYSGKDGQYCYPLRYRQTPVRNMIVETNGKKQNISLKAEDWYNVSIPISFSGNGKYLIVQKNIAYDGGDGDTVFSVYDLENNYRKLSLYPCEKSYGGGEYKGFVSSSEVLFDCYQQNHEIINLQNQFIRQVSEQDIDFKEVESYGKVLSSTKITKKQVFD